MEPPFPEMESKKIRVTSAGKSGVGKLVAYWRPTERRFGLRIDIIHPPVYHQRDESIPLAQWVDVGYIPVTTLKLSQDQIWKIVRSNDTECDFVLTIN